MVSRSPTFTHAERPPNPAPSATCLTGDIWTANTERDTWTEVGSIEYTVKHAKTDWTQPVTWIGIGDGTGRYCSFYVLGLLRFIVQPTIRLWPSNLVQGYLSRSPDARLCIDRICRQHAPSPLGATVTVPPRQSGLAQFALYRAEAHRQAWPAGVRQWVNSEPVQLLQFALPIRLALPVRSGPVPPR
ncbi:unnamed protein product [Peniophora sp. CBMAI 1063]|nr:unnamed protein product [Peniophora sp. CBMAI 1063]